jgi:hypothetical protein
MEEVRDILTTFEDIYRSQFPELKLRAFAKPIFTWLTHQSLDPDATGRVTTDHLTRLVISALRHSYEQGDTSVNEQVLHSRASIMILRRDEITAIDGTSSQPSYDATEVG